MGYSMTAAGCCCCTGSLESFRMFRIQLIISRSRAPTSSIRCVLPSSRSLSKTGRPVFDKLREEGKTHRIEDVGARLREMMSWIRNIRKDSSEPVQQQQQPAAGIEDPRS